MNPNLINQLNQSSFSFFFLVVDNFLDIDVYDQLKHFHLIYASHSPLIDKLKNQGRNYLCLEDEGITLRQKNTGQLLSHPRVVEYIKSNSLGQTVIIPFKPSAKIDFLCRQYGWIKAANQASINRLFEDKVKFVEICTQNNITTIPSVIDRLTPDTYALHQHLYGPTMVIQTHFGWAGKSTYKTTDWSDLTDKIAPGTTVKFSPFLTGYSLLNNCCLTPEGLLQSPPALQFTGLPQFTQNEFATVGRQWPSLAPSVVTSQVKDITTRFSNILKGHDYKGFFGLDFFVLPDNTVYLLECNPRLTASFSFYTQLETKASLTPLFFYHLASFLDLKFSLPESEVDHRFNSPDIVGSELTPKDKNGTTITKINTFSVLTKTINPISIPTDILTHVPRSQT